MYKYPVTDTGFRLTLDYLGYFEVLQLSRELDELFEERKRLRRKFIRLEEELARLQTRHPKTEPRWRRGHSVISFYREMSQPSSRPRTRQSEPVRPASRQNLVREKSSVTPRPSSRVQNSLRPNTSLNKREYVIPQKSFGNTSVPEINLDQAYKENGGLELGTKPLWYPESDSGSEKLQAPVLPIQSMRPKRETTSFGVYSNLSSHNRNVSLELFAEEELPRAEGPQLQLLENIKRNNTAQVRFILDSNQKMKLAFSDESGEAVLHTAVKTLNQDIIKLLLGRKMSTEAHDKTGRNALHIASSLGSLPIVDLLLKNGTGVNSSNKLNKRTALHEATIACHSDVVEFLLLRGINPEIKDKAGQTAAMYCSPKFPRKEYDRILSTVASSKMDIETLHHSGKTLLLNTSLAIDITNNKLTDDPLILFKRQGADQCGVTFDLHECEDVTSDVFTYTFPQMLKVPIEATVSLPVLYAPRSSKEELKVKTSTESTISPSEVLQENNGWRCVFNTTLQQSGAFVVVCRPTMEEFEVGKDNIVLSLTADPRVKMSVQRGDFNKQALVTIQVLEPTDDTEIEENQIISSTPFYKIQCSTQPTKPFTIELPIPEDYGHNTDTKLAVLARPSEGGEWRVMSDINTKSETVTFNVKESSLYLTVVKAVSSFNKDALSDEINNILKQMTVNTFKICFLCMSKRSVKTNKFFMVVECCEETMLETRRRVWSSKGYIEQKQKEPIDKFTASPKQAFHIVFYDNIVTKKNKRVDVLRYHPKRDSVVMFELPDDVPLVSARIFIYKTNNITINGDSVNADDVLENRRDLIKSIDIMKVEFTREKTVIPHDSNTESRTYSQNKVFLTDSLLAELIVEMDKEWYKICILMGVTFRQVENCLIMEGKLRNKIKELMKDWRNEKQSREDIGLPLMMSALFKGGRRDIANLVQIELKKWYSSVEDKDSKFYGWVTRAYKDSDLLVPSDYPKPMSDEYLVLMAEDLSPSQQLARSLNLTDTETDDILHSDSYLQDGIRVMKMLTLFRDTISNRIDSLQSLIDCLDKLGFEKLKNYSIMCAKAWLKRTATRKDDPLRYQVDAYLKKLAR